MNTINLIRLAFVLSFLLSLSMLYAQCPTQCISASSCLVEVDQPVTLSYTCGGNFVSLAWNGVNGIEDYTTSWSTAGTKTVNLQVFWCEPGECSPATSLYSISIQVQNATPPPPPPPSGCLNALSGLTLCTGQDANFEVTCTKHYTYYSWNGAIDDKTHTTSWPNSGTYTLTVWGICEEFDCGVESQVQLGTVTIQILGPNGIPEIVASTPQSLNTHSVCDDKSLSLRVNNSEPGVTYQWSSSPPGFSAFGTNVSPGPISQSTTYTVTSSKDACSRNASTLINKITTQRYPIVDQSASDYHKTLIRSDGGGVRQEHHWQSSPSGTSNNPTGLNFTDYPLLYNEIPANPVYVNRFSSDGNCWTNPLFPLPVPMNYEPPLAQITKTTAMVSPLSKRIEFTHPDKNFINLYADYYWLNYNGCSGGDILWNINQPFFISQNGTYSLRGKDRVTGTWGPILTVVVNDISPCEISGPRSVCQGSEVTYSSNCSDPKYEDFSWTLSGPTTAMVNEDLFTHRFTEPGCYTLSLEGICDDLAHSCPPNSFTTIQIEVKPNPQSPIILASQTSVCEITDIMLSVQNVEPDVTYSWTSDDGQSASGPSAVLTAGLGNTTFTKFKVTATKNGCSVETETTVLVHWTQFEPVQYQTEYRKSWVRAIGTGFRPAHYWQLTASGVETDHVVDSDPIDGFYLSEPATFYIRRYNSTNNCWTVATGPLNVSIDYAPPVPIVTIQKQAGYNRVYLNLPNESFVLQYADYYWVDDYTTNSNPRLFQEGDIFLREGNYYLRGKDRETSTWGPFATIQIKLKKDFEFNWIHTTAFAETEAVIAESKAYFDDAGRSLQAQTKNLEENYIFATENLRDRYERVVGSILPAPIIPKEFNYNSLLNASLQGLEYDADDFDNPATGTVVNPLAVNDTFEGTVGWYYSDNNAIEPLTPTTKYPYSRIEFYEDGTGAAKRSAAPGDFHRLGTGHEVLSGTFPVVNELNDYLLKRNSVLPGVQHDGSLYNEGVQSVGRDENGKYVISITDKEGRTVMTARKGTATDHVHQINNIVTGNGDASSPAFHPLIYFYILDSSPVILSGSGNFTVQDLISNETKPLGQTFADTNGSWPAGFYRITLNGGQLTVNYTNYYSDVAYQFYDYAGRLVASISPNGYQALKNGTAYNVIDKTTYQHNHQGWLLSMTEPDAGTTNYKYRKDGKIRFSQNALQKENETNGATGKGRFSYTNYDESGRPVESGEYIGSVLFSSLNDKLEFAQQVLYATNEKKDWVKTYYDFPATEIPNLPSTYKQEFVRGAVSWTENANIKTWYSYDELGRVVWMAQKPARLNRTFVVKYMYDFLGNVLTVFNSSYVNGAILDPFYHHYEYDKDKRLSKAYTSTDGSNKKLRATYEYYLHGPLKRIELGDKLQGIDFVYNINGWLTQINHPDNTRDPGGDGTNGVKEDVFGMILDYYQSDLNNLFSTSSIMPYNLNQLHGIPSEANQTLIASHQPLIRFSPFEEYEQGRPSMFKEYSAEHERYRKMILEMNQKHMDR